MAKSRKTDTVELVEIIDEAAESKPASKTGNAMFEDWKSGTSIKELVVKYGCTRPQCRRKLTDAAGGKAAFKAMRQDGAGGNLAAFGGVRGTRVPNAVSDKDVPRMTDTTGWGSRREWRNAIIPIKDFGSAAWREIIAHVFVAPSGIEYVHASGSEKADLIIDFTDKGLGITRLRKLEGSRAEKRIDAVEKDDTLERGEIALKRTRARKREARKQRKARRSPK